MGEVITLIKHAELGEAAGAQKNKNMKKHFVLSLLAGLGWLSSVGAERVAPTFPEFVNFENGKDYYFYNVGAGKFLSTDDYGNYAYMSDWGLKALASSVGDDVYSIMLASTNEYLHYNSYPILGVDYRSFASYQCSWSIASVGDKTYTIQVAPINHNYDADKYVGCKSGEDLVYLGIFSKYHKISQLIHTQSVAN